MNKIGRNKTLYLLREKCKFKEIHYEWDEEGKTYTEIWTENNEYVGLADLGIRAYNVHFIYKHRLTNLMSTKRALGKPLEANSCNPVSVGFSEKEQAWYGWSHRGYSKFQVGQTTGLDFMFPIFPKHYIPHEIKTLEQAKEVAAYFAEYIS